MGWLHEWFSYEPNPKLQRMAQPQPCLPRFNNNDDNNNNNNDNSDM
jgi:hypothetical protein